jgi:hypothetical protein
VVELLARIVAARGELALGAPEETASVLHDLEIDLACERSSRTLVSLREPKCLCCGRKYRPELRR